MGRDMPASPRPPRKIRYVDESIQKGLLVALVLLEVALAGASVWLLNRQLNAVIDDNLYRIHMADAEPMFAQLLHQAALVLGTFIAVNIAALLAADRIWSRHVNGVVRSLMHLVAKTGRMDFSADPEPGDRHETLHLASAWRARERARLAAIRDLVTQLDGRTKVDDDPVEIRGALERLRKLLPEY